MDTNLHDRNSDIEMDTLPYSSSLELPDFIEVECWGSLAEHVAESLEKGSRVVVTGSLCQNSWTDSEGNKRSTIRIRATAVGLSLEFSSCKALEKEA